ncbi:MAG: S24/S26 family peptidase [Myxococcota bacterium]
MNRDDAALHLILEAVARGSAVCMRAAGSSMWPSIPGGTMVELAPRGPAPLLPGAVVAARRDNGAFLIHRVRGVRHDGSVLLQGDNCSRPDGWFEAREICAQVCRIDLGHGFVPVSSAPLPRPNLVQRAAGKLRRSLRSSLRRMTMSSNPWASPPA